MRLSAAGTAHAFGIAASQAAGLTKNFGSMTKSLHVGHAAQCGITAATLAAKGFTASTAAFEGDTGFIAAYRGERHAALEDLVRKLGAPWELEQPGLYRKRFPCCYAAHRPAAGLMELLAEEGIATEDIQAIRIGYRHIDTAQMYDNEPESVASLVVVSTLISAVTVPLLLAVLVA